jgi:plastocyanin
MSSLTIILMNKWFVIIAVASLAVVFAVTNINALDVTATPTVDRTNTTTGPIKVQAGIGNGTVAIQLFSPKQIDIKSGESVTWYNPTPVPEPHTVTFVLDNKSMAHVVEPFAVPASATNKFSPIVPNSNSEPAMTPDNKGIIGLNKRVYNPVVIDSQSNANYMNQNANYTLTGTEKYVNSGWLLPKGQEQIFPGSGNTFTVTFGKAGTYNYICSIHPYMTGSIAVK